MSRTPALLDTDHQGIEVGNRRYLLISPCRNEAECMRRTLDSVIGQSEPPTHWIIVDDGSTDETGSILAEYASKHVWIEVVRRGDRGRRAVGGGVVEAFDEGLNRVDIDSFDYLCKLDMDLVLPTDYFAHLMDRMEKESRLGTCSGKAYYPGAENSAATFNGTLIDEGIGDDMSVGAAKFYRVACFQQIGGFVQQVMWDGIDCHRCRMNGWIAGSWDDPELRFIHLRPMGSSHQGILTGRIRHGYGQYFMGTGPFYMAASVLFRLKQRPYLIGAAATGWGYVRSFLRREPRYEDDSFRRFLRRYHWLCLTRGKQYAADSARRQEPIAELDKSG